MAFSAEKTIISPEELPEELRMVLTPMLQEKAEKTKKADAGAAVARACGVDNK